MKKVKMTKELFGILRAYTKLFGRIEKRYYKKIDNLEKIMQQETGIKDIGFFFCYGECVGIGNQERTMDLIDRYKLEGK